MTRAVQGPNTEMADNALAVVVANTRMAERRGVRRPHSLTEIAEAIRAAEEGFGSLKEVAQRVGITVGMLRRFLSVEGLHPKVVPLVAARRIDSLNLVHYTATLPRADQPAVAEAILNGKLSGTDVRALAPLRNRLPEAGVTKLIARITSSRDRTVYAIAFTLMRANSLPRIRSAFTGASRGGLIAIRSEGSRRYKAVLTRRGLQQLRAAAREADLTLRGYVKRILTDKANDAQ